MHITFTKVSACLAALVACTLHLYAQPTLNEESPQKKSPEQVALRFIQLIANNQLDLDQHTAISSNCSELRRDDIKQKTRALQTSHFTETSHFFIESSKTAGSLAGVLIGSKNKDQPLQTHLFRVALILKDQTWLPAPVIGSFTNSGYGYDPEVETNVTALESWLTKQKAKSQAKHKSQSHKNYLTTLLKLEQAAQLDQITPEDAFYRFVDHCRKKDTSNALVSMGAASDQLSAPLEQALINVQAGIHQQSKYSHWAPLNLDHYIAQVLFVDEENSTMTVGFYHILNNGRSKASAFEYFKHQGKTFLRLSNVSQKNKKQLGEFRRIIQKPNAQFHAENNSDKILDAILKRFSISQATSPEQAKQHLTRAIENQDFKTLLPLLPHQGAIYELPENRHLAIKHLYTLWNNIKDTATKDLTSSPLYSSDNLAMLPIPSGTASHQTKLWLLRNDLGWHIIDRAAHELDSDIELLKNAQELESQHALYLENLAQKDKADILNQIKTISLPLTSDPVTEEQALQTLQAYRTALRANSSKQALSHTIFSKEEDIAQVFKSLKYKIKGALNHIEYDHYLGSSTSGQWRALSHRTESKTTAIKDYPLYLIVQTDEGAKILHDIDLRHSSNKGRQILNTKLLKQLKKTLPADEFHHIQTLFDEHNQRAKKDIIKLREMMQ